MIGLFFASLLFSQEAGTKVVAVLPDDPTSWTLEYPYMIAPYIDDYYNCLKSRELFAGDERSFETQHRDAILQCSKVEVRSESEANAILARRGRSAATTPDDVAGFFATIRMIHIARGKDIDDQLAMGLGGDPYAPQGMGAATAETEVVNIEMLEDDPATTQAGQ